MPATRVLSHAHTRSRWIGILAMLCLAALPLWSPHGRQIAFDSYQSGNAEIYLIGTDGSHQTNFTTDPADDTHPSWSPTPYH